MEVELPSMPASIRQTYQGRLAASKQSLDKIKKTLVSLTRRFGYKYPPALIWKHSRRKTSVSNPNDLISFPDLGSPTETTHTPTTPNPTLLDPVYWLARRPLKMAPPGSIMRTGLHWRLKALDLKSLGIWEDREINWRILGILQVAMSPIQMPATNPL